MPSDAGQLCVSKNCKFHEKQPISGRVRLMFVAKSHACFLYLKFPENTLTLSSILFLCALYSRVSVLNKRHIDGDDSALVITLDTTSSPSSNPLLIPVSLRFAQLVYPK